MATILALCCIALAQGKSSRVQATVLNRRGASAALVTLVGASIFPLPGLAASAGAVPTNLIDEIQTLGAEAKRLREVARVQGKSAAALLSRGLDASLAPLQTKMLAAAPKDSPALIQAQLMQGHLLELRQALAESDFATYTSKRSKQTYPGGKVERELEEVSETVEEFLTQVRPSPWAGRYTDPFHPTGYRDISVRGRDLSIAGRDDPKGQAWALSATINADGVTALIDFSPKGGPKNLLARLQGNTIVFPDGNKWTKVL